MLQPPHLTLPTPPPSSFHRGLHKSSSSSFKFIPYPKILTHPPLKRKVYCPSLLNSSPPPKPPSLFAQGHYQQESVALYFLMVFYDRNSLHIPLTSFIIYIFLYMCPFTNIFIKTNTFVMNGYTPKRQIYHLKQGMFNQSMRTSD